MMRIAMVLVATTIIASTLLSQQTAMWECTIYVEDAIGNRDSVIIGKDLQASNDEVNTQFGEVDISHVPWDSVFEVRAANLVKVGYTEPEDAFFQSKKVISRLPEVHVFSDCIFPSQSPPIMIRAIHRPVTITWDSTLFDNTCLLRTYIASHRWPSAHPSWMGIPGVVDETTCMKGGSHFITSLPILNDAEPGFGSSVKYVDIEGGSRDSVIGVQVYGATNGDMLTPCQHLTLTDVEDLHYQNENFLYPSPVGDVLMFRSNYTNTHYIIYDMAGQYILHGSDHEIDVSMLKSGMYVIALVDKNGGVVYQKFMKL